ncbi:enoyl-CoA hydratase-related protein [Paludibacterium yongneupense]|uniref:enoyl-CoA hydratase-related protein n=1 Tax=Paludibacterium yongneupense TaxID=400061 RepID=UPI000411D692|nr:enoyl-CoA hydratase-related protein [Paludibacterium yongneupense]
MGQFLMQEQLGLAAIVTYRNPPGNVWVLEAVCELAETVTALGARSDIRALVLTGAGDACFSVGSDCAALSLGGAAFAERWAAAWEAALGALDRYPGVTVAALNGDAMGVGLGCALACDFMVVERRIRLGMPETRMGLVPLAGCSKRLVDKVGQAWAKRILLGGEEVDAELACRIGLAEELVDPGCAKIVALSLAGKAARQGAQAVAATRGLLREAASSTLARQAQHEHELYLRLLAGEEAREGLAALAAGRVPGWVPDED